MMMMRFWRSIERNYKPLPGVFHFYIFDNVTALFSVQKKHEQSAGHVAEQISTSVIVYFSVTCDSTLLYKCNCRFENIFNTDSSVNLLPSHSIKNLQTSK